jgi:hypothetical protein
MELARSICLRSPCGEQVALMSSGTALENRYVYDSVAREFKQLEREGLVSLACEEFEDESGDRLIGRLVFVRLR